MLKKTILILSTLLTTFVYAKDTLASLAEYGVVQDWLKTSVCSNDTFMLKGISRFYGDNQHFKPDLPSTMMCTIGGNTIKVHIVNGYHKGGGFHYPIDNQAREMLAKLPKDDTQHMVAQFVAFFVNNTQISVYKNIDFINISELSLLSFTYRYDEERQQYYIAFNTTQIEQQENGFLSPYIKNHPKLRLTSWSPVRGNLWKVEKDHSNPAIIVHPRHGEESGARYTRTMDDEKMYTYKYDISIYENIVQPDGTVSP